MDSAFKIVWLSQDGQDLCFFHLKKLKKLHKIIFFRCWVSGRAGQCYRQGNVYRAWVFPKVEERKLGL